jgi:Na+-transporting methylmalonyl-CoA/oxaloacetate decarboxylase gamma subunit
MSKAIKFLILVLVVLALLINNSQEQQASDFDEEDEAEETPKRAFVVKQSVLDEETWKTIAAAIEYMNNELYANPDKYPERIAKNCRNQEGLCAFWAATGNVKKILPI